MFGHHSCHHNHMQMDDMMDSTLFKVLAIGTLLYFGAKTIHHMMED